MGDPVTPDPYWDDTCAGCLPEGRVHTNLQCVMWIAQATRTPLADAKRMFRRDHRQEAHESRMLATHWQEQE